MTPPIAPQFSGHQFTPYFAGARKGKKHNRFASAAPNTVTAPMAPIPAPVDVAPIATTQAQPDFPYTRRMMWHV